MIGPSRQEVVIAANRKEARLLEAMCDRVEPLIPPQSKGGHHFMPDYECFCGIVYQLRSAIRWNDMPKENPSGSTCWRRFDLWTRISLWSQVHRINLDELSAAALLDLSELALDATFA